MSQATPGARFEIEVELLPLAGEVPGFSAAAGIPQGAALLGGAGEYEFLFSIAEPSPKGAVHLLEDMGCRSVGRTSRGEAPGVFINRGNREFVAMSEPPPCPRASGSAEAHISDVAAMAETLFGRGTG